MYRSSQNFLLCLLPVVLTGSLAHAAETPNVVIIFTDDQGYADVGCYGAEGFETPNLDRMAAEGRKFTSFYVSQAVCGASRASLLTGCYANRIGMLGAPSHRSTHGINADEVLIPELCKQKGCATGMYGKWHLGHHLPFLPLQNGFDDYYGLPYSNDMWPFHPTNPGGYPNLPMYGGNEIVDTNVTPEDQVHLTTSYAERAVKFINDHKDEPFYLYVAHSMPHVPLFVTDKFDGKSEQGPYGDVIMEIDWSVGEILGALKKNGIDDNTLVIFTTDNGPWLSYGNHAGSAKPLREGKGTMWEGGCRVPCIMRWPGKIPAGTECEQWAATIDILPTVADLIGAELPEHPIDGKNIWPLMAGEEGATSPHEYYCYYWGRELQAIRSGDWKLHFPHSYRSLTGEPGMDGTPNGYTQARTGLALFNLAEDIGETTDVKDDHPEIVEKLKAYADEAREELGDSAHKMQGSGYRAPGRWTPDAAE